MAKQLSKHEWIAARAMWEADETLSYGDIGKRFRVSKQTIHRRAKLDGWIRSPVAKADLQSRAHDLADESVKADQVIPVDTPANITNTPETHPNTVHAGRGEKAVKSALSAVKTDAASTTPAENVTRDLATGAPGLPGSGNVPASQEKRPQNQELITKADQVAEDAVREAALDERAKERAKILTRHREEVNLPRRLLYEAVKAKSLDQVNMAKAASATLVNIHKLERLAWGLEGDGPKAGMTIIIERT